MKVPVFLSRSFAQPDLHKGDMSNATMTLDLCILQTVLASDLCVTDIVSLSVCSVFISASAAMHLYLQFWNRPSSSSHSCRELESNCQPFHPLHSLLWLLMMAQAILAMTNFGEVVLWPSPVPLSVAERLIQLLTWLVAAPIYLGMAERRPKASAMVPLLVLVTAQCIIMAFRLIQEKESWKYLRQHIALSQTAVCGTLTLLLAISMAKQHMFLTRDCVKPRESSGSTLFEECVYHYNHCAFPSKLTFAWLLPLLRQGYKAPLELNDLGRLPGEERAFVHHQRLKQSLKELGAGSSILRACLISNWRLVATGGIFRLLADGFGLAGALSIKYIVESITAEVNGTTITNYTDEANFHNDPLTADEFFSNGLVIAVLIFLAALFQGSFSQMSNHLLGVAGVRSKNALHVMLYEKALKLPISIMQQQDQVMAQQHAFCACSSTDEDNNEGHIDLGLILNLASEDVLNVREFMWNIHYLWSLPLKVIVIVGLLYTKMGVSGAVAVALGSAIILPLQFATGKLMSDNNRHIFSAQDARMTKSTETMQGMKTVKLGCLEHVSLKKIESARSQELCYLRKDSFFWSIMSFLASVSTIIMTTTAVWLYMVLEDTNFSPADLFSALALLGQLTVCLSVFPVTVPIFIKGLVSRERLLEFFLQPEISQYKMVPTGGKMFSLYNTSDTQSPGEKVKLPVVAFTIEKGYFAWPKTNTSALHEITLSVKTGSLTAVIGPSGSGKSALILALLEELERLSGELRWNLPASVAFTGQKPWLLNASVRDNILLGRPFKEKRYQKVLAACDLNADINLLPDGDETEVGEHGVLLSGGQRQRLSVARCLYSKAACSFFDAPFSSLDASITSQIFKQGIQDILLKRRRTVIMATDRLDFLEKADNVIYIQDGCMCATGPVPEVLRAHPEIRVNMKAVLTRSKLGSTTGSSSDAEGLVEGPTAQERWRLLRNVTRWSMSMSKNMQRRDRQPSSNCHSTSIQAMTATKPLLRTHARALFLLKRESSLKLHRLRMDSSSERSLCHDIMLPSDECQEAGGSTGGGGSFNQTATASGSPRPNALFHRSQLSKQSLFSRASSWTMTANNSSSSSRVLGVSSSSSMLVRQMAVTGAPPTMSSTTPQHAVKLNQSNDSHKLPKPNFHRMCSFHHMLAFKYNHHLRGSSTSLQKHSNSEPDGFSLDPVHPPNLQMSKDTSVAVPHKHIARMTSTSSAVSHVSGFSDDFHEDENDEAGGVILSKDASSQEKREYGQIGAFVYMEYFRAGGLSLAVLFLLVSFSMQALKVYMDFLLRDWSAESSDTLSMNYLSWYSSCSLAVLVLSCFANLLGQVMGAQARRQLHERMLHSLIHAPLELFESWPVGRIINRFSYDMFVVDQKLPSAVQRLTLVSLICMSALVVNAIQSPLFLLIALPMTGVYFWLQHFYRTSSRELQRLDSLSRAPVLSHFSDTLGGLVTIRAFGEQTRFINQLCEKVDTNTTAFMLLQSGCRWLGLWLDFTGAAMVFASVVMSLTVGHKSSASVGLTMNYSLLVPIYLAWVVKFLADIENHMNAVERILEYMELESEESTFVANDSAAIAAMGDLWTRRECVIKFDSVGLAHSPSMRAVIPNLTLVIPPRQKVGICGHSGSGKSTLLMGLARITKILYGQVTLDGHNVAQLPLAELRRFVWTVPQDVTLFSGTVRDNLDPEVKFTDDQIWDALEKLGLRSLLSPRDGLEMKVTENGENFSLGQKQQLSLARAVLLHPPVVLLDEATSALDAATEVELHQRLLTTFADSTMVAVTHRIANIINYDQVIVMGNGKILEEGRPRQLLKKPMGFFSALWRAAGEKPL